jgi:hypothetical protein
MADSGSEDERDTARISVKFKTTTETIPLEVGDKWAISRVKSSLSEKANQPVEKICLIFSGPQLNVPSLRINAKFNDAFKTSRRSDVVLLPVKLTIPINRQSIQRHSTKPSVAPR